MNWIAEAQKLTEAGQPFALATVVRRVAPASAQRGAKAIILPDGSMRGWVGGSCAQPVVVAEARNALHAGSPRLIRLGLMPAARESDDVVEYPMTCHSGGALEILIEPVLPAARLSLVGETPVAETLAALAQVMGYRVDRFGNAKHFAADADGLAASFVVVATMGVDDEETLAAALRSPAAYVALVASPKRAAAVRETLAIMGVTPEELAQLKAPAGLDIGARSQEEIALSIMAEIAQARAALTPGLVEEADAAATASEPGENTEAIDPICEMSVTIATARHTSEYDGKTWYFCCAGCKRRFEADPAHYAAA